MTTPRHAAPSRWTLIVLWVCAACCVTVLAAITIVVGIPAVTGGVAVTVTTGSMSPSIRPGALVVARGVSAADACTTIQPGEVVVYNRPGQGLITHRVAGMSYGAFQDGTKCSFTTQGDANTTADAPVSPAQLRGRYVLQMPWIGPLWERLGPQATTAIVIAVVAALLAACWGLFRASGHGRRPLAVQLAGVRSEPELEAQPSEETLPETTTPAAPTVEVRDHDVEEQMTDYAAGGPSENPATPIGAVPSAADQQPDDWRQREHDLKTWENDVRTGAVATTAASGGAAAPAESADENVDDTTPPVRAAAQPARYSAPESLASELRSTPEQLSTSEPLGAPEVLAAPEPRGVTEPRGAVDGGSGSFLAGIDTTEPDDERELADAAGPFLAAPTGEREATGGQQPAAELSVRFEAAASWERQIQSRLSALDQREKELLSDRAALAGERSAVDERTAQLMRAEESLRGRQAEMADRGRRLWDQSTQLEVRARELDEAQRKLEEEAEQLPVWRSELEDADARLRGREALLAERHTSLEKREQRLAASMAALGDKEAKLIAREAAAEEREEHFTFDRERFRATEASLSARAADIDAREARLGAAERELADAARFREAESARLAELERRLHEADAHLQATSAGVAERGRALAESERSLRAQAAQLAEHQERLANQIADLIRRESELRVMQSAVQERLKEVTERERAAELWAAHAPALRDAEARVTTPVAWRDLAASYADHDGAVDESLYPVNSDGTPRAATSTVTGVSSEFDYRSLVPKDAAGYQPTRRRSA